MIDWNGSRHPTDHGRTLRRLVRGLTTLLALLALVLPVSSAAAQETSPPETASDQADTDRGTSGDGDQEIAAEAELPPMPKFMSAGFGSAIEAIGNDLFFWGQSGSITGTVGDNAFMGGQFISLDGGRVDGDLFVFASSATIDGEVAGDVYAFVADFRLGDGARVQGNVICGCGSLRIDGDVRGRIHGGGGATWINGDVGPVDIEAGKLTVGDGARIRGHLHYQSNDEAEIADGAEILGDVRRSTETDEEEEDEEEPWISGWGVGWSLWIYLSSLVVGLAVLLVGGEPARRPAARLGEAPAWGLGFGFVVAVVVPVACVLAMVLVVSLPLGVIGLLLYVIAVFLGRLVTAQFVGDWVLRRFGTAGASEYLALALGLLALQAAAAVPYVGFLIRLMAVVAGLGGIYLAIRGDRPGTPEPSTREAGVA